MSMENGSDALSLSYDEVKKGFRTIQSGMSNLSMFQTIIDAYDFDYLDVGYPTTSSETVALVSGGVTGDVLATFTIVYTDETKTAVSNIALV